MGNKNQDQKYLEIEVPEEVMAEVAEIISENEMEAKILGVGEEQESILIGFNYHIDERNSMMQVLELVEDCYTDEEQEEESEED
jgi:hypothetical protein